MVFIRLLRIVALVLVITVIGITVSLTLPTREGREGGTLVVTKGQSASAIARTLKSSGFVRSMYLTGYLLARSGRSTEIKTGSYPIPAGSNTFTIVRILTSETPSSEKRLTFIEGWDLSEYVSYLTKNGFSETTVLDAFGVDSWKERYWFLQGLPGTRTIEGYAFPDTYVIPGDASVESLVDYMLRTFEKRITENMRADIVRSKRTLDEVIILASIVENEVAGDDDRKIVAGIFLNRLANDIGLQSDATINYLTKSGRSRSTLDDLAIDSPYNTYRYRGLPPGPIGNPGLSAITAVIYPEQTPYFYFLTDTEGVVHYARNFEEHQKNRSLYLK